MYTAKLTSKGQITVPKHIRQHMGLSPGDAIMLIPQADSHVTMAAKNLSIEDIAGLVQSEQHFTLEEITQRMHDAIEYKYRPTKMEGYTN